MNGDLVILELAGLVRAGIPAFEARASLRERLDELQKTQSLQFETIWSVAEQSGGPVADAMNTLSHTFSVADRHRREIELAFAGPRATARLVNLLPLACLGLAQCFGLNPVGAIATKPLAFLAFSIGVALLIVGHLWSRRILAKAEISDLDPAIFIEAVKFALVAGLPITRAIQMVTETFGRLMPDLDLAETTVEVNRFAELNRERGASLLALLDSAARVRRESKHHLEATRVAKLSVKLMIPLGLVTLPAFILCTVVPIAIGLLANQ
jgi:tight adherence protein B